MEFWPILVTVLLFVVAGLIMYYKDYGVLPFAFGEKPKRYIDACKAILKYYKACPYAKTILGAAQVQILQSYKAYKKGTSNTYIDNYESDMFDEPYPNCEYWAMLFILYKINNRPKYFAPSKSHKYEDEFWVLGQLKSLLEDELRKYIQYDSFPESFIERWGVIIYDETEHIGE